MATPIEAGTWVQVHQVILFPGERAAGVPDDTARVPYEVWVKGFLAAPTAVGDEAVVTTVTGRQVTGTLVDPAPGHDHSFGRPHPAMLAVGPALKKLLSEGDAP